MKQTHRIRSWYERSRQFTFLFGIVLVMGVSWNAVAEGETAEDERSGISQAALDEITRMDEELLGAPKKSGEISCDDNLCTGRYRDMIAYRWERDNGEAMLRAKAAFEAALGASSMGCSDPRFLALKRYDDTGSNRNATISRWQADFIAAEALGYQLQIRWKGFGSNWPGCVVERILVWPASDEP